MNRPIDDNLEIRNITEEDLLQLWALAFKDKNPEWKKWDVFTVEHHGAKSGTFTFF